MKVKSICFAIALAIPLSVMADNIIRVAAPVQKHVEQWVASSPLYGEWTSLSRTCGAWAPDAATMPSGQSFSQSRSCNQQESRTIQQREYNAQQNLYRNLGEPTTENRSVTEEESQNAVGTKAVVSTFKINNPVAGVNGIYSVTDTASNTNFNAYVNMTDDGGYWVLAAYWVVPSEMPRYLSQLLYRENALSTYSKNTATYPVIPSGKINGSTRALLKSKNSSWISMFGTWQSFDTMANGTTTPYHQAKTSIGDKIIYTQSAGWPSSAFTGVSQYNQFGFWTTYGNSGPCGGENRVGTNKMCIMTGSGYSPHGDAATDKFYFLKAE